MIALTTDPSLWLMSAEPTHHRGPNRAGSKTTSRSSVSPLDALGREHTEASRGISQARSRAQSAAFNSGQNVKYHSSVNVM